MIRTCAGMLQKIKRGIAPLADFSAAGGCCEAFCAAIPAFLRHGPSGKQVFGAAALALLLGELEKEVAEGRNISQGELDECKGFAHLATEPEKAALCRLQAVATAKLVGVSAIGGGAIVAAGAESKATRGKATAAKSSVLQWLG